MEIELTSARSDGSFTWRAAGAREPKGVVTAALLPTGAKPGDVLRAEVEQAINDRSPRLRYPVGEPAVAILAARAGMSDEEWVELGRHETLEAYFGELMSHAPAPADNAATVTKTPAAQQA